MSLTDGLVARFNIHFRCLNCERNITQKLDVPDVEDAPRDVDELLESAFFRSKIYMCNVCDSAIGTLVGVSQQRLDEEAL